MSSSETFFLLSSSKRLIENIANRKSSLVQVKIHIADAHFERYIGLSSFLASLFIWYLLGEWRDFKRMAAKYPEVYVSRAEQYEMIAETL